MNQETTVVGCSRQKGRPRVNTDVPTIVKLHDVDKLGWSLIAERFRQINGQYISRDTVKRRYNEAKKQQSSGVVSYKRVPSVLIAKPNFVYKPVVRNPETASISGLEEG